MALEREALATALFAARRNEQPEKIRALLAGDAGSTVLTSVKLGLEKLRDAQFALLTERDHQSYLQAQSTRWVVGLGSALNFLLFGLVGWLLRDDLAMRRRAATVMAEANVQLERKVLERTAELLASNTKLRAENLERRWTTTSQEHQLRYNQLFIDSINDLLLVITRAQNVTRVNPAVVHISGRTEETLLTQPLAQIVVVAPDPITGLDPIGRALEEGRELRHHPAIVLGPGRKEIPARLTLLPLRDQNKVVGGVVVVQVAFAVEA
jgi:PAS domain S-box-containing protein